MCKVLDRKIIILYSFSLSEAMEDRWNAYASEVTRWENAILVEYSRPTLRRI